MKGLGLAVTARSNLTDVQGKQNGAKCVICICCNIVCIVILNKGNEGDSGPHCQGEFLPL